MYLLRVKWYQPRLWVHYIHIKYSLLRKLFEFVFCVLIPRYLVFFNLVLEVTYMYMYFYILSIYLIEAKMNSSTIKTISNPSQGFLWNCFKFHLTVFLWPLCSSVSQTATEITCWDRKWSSNDVSLVSPTVVPSLCRRCSTCSDIVSVFAVLKGF